MSTVYSRKFCTVCTAQNAEPITSLSFPGVHYANVQSVFPLVPPPLQNRATQIQIPTDELPFGFTARSGQNVAQALGLAKHVSGLPAFGYE